MKITLTIQNYRCFVRPITLEIAKDFTGFVGVNNAGKSALMRFLLEFRDVFRNLTNSNHMRDAMRTSYATNLIHVLDPTESFSNLNDRPIEFAIEFLYDEGENNSVSLKRASFTYDHAQRSHVVVEDHGGRRVGGPGTAVNALTDFTFQSGQTSHAIDCKLLRGVLSRLASSLYIGPFRNTVSVGNNDAYIDIQIGESFIKTFKEYKNGNIRKHNDQILQLTDDIRRIFAFETLNIDATPDNKSLHLAINGRSYKQHELGSGLAQFILVLANVAIRNPAYVLIDEPELGLHPRLQLDFLTTLGSYATEGVWFSTHSLGLARSTTHRVYSVRRIGDGNSDVKLLAGTPRLAEFLGEMSFSAHRELGFEKVLLVEGATDVKTVQQILRKFGQDHRVLLLSLFGRINGDIAEELEEVMRITSDVYAVIDSEKVSESADLAKPRKQFIELCDKLKIKRHVLERRATENYFPDRVIKQIYGSSYRSLQPYEKLSDVSPHWGKAENWRLAYAMSNEEIMSTDFGRFLHSIVK